MWDLWLTDTLGQVGPIFRHYLPVVVSMNLVIASVTLAGPTPEQFSCCLFLPVALPPERPVGTPSRLDSSSEVDTECELAPNIFPSCSAA